MAILVIAGLIVSPAPLTICVRWAWVPCRRLRRSVACEQPSFGYQHGKCAAAAETGKRSGRRVSSGSRRALVRVQSGPWPRSGANHDQWAAEAAYDIHGTDRTRLFSYFDLVRRWDAVKHAAVPWHDEQSVWTSRWLF